MTATNLDLPVLLQAVNHSPQGWLVCDLEADGQPVVFTNAAFSRLSGIAAEELAGVGAAVVARLLAARTDEKSDGWRRLQFVFEHRGHLTLTLQARRADGTAGWSELVLSPIVNAVGRETHLLGVLTDITPLKDAEEELTKVRRGLARRVAARTADLRKSNESFYNEILERRKAERALRAAERKYRGIFENAIEGVYQSTPDGRYLSVNPALAQLYGFASVEQMMTAVADIAQDVYVDPGMRARFRAAIERDGEVRNLEYEVRRRDGTCLWISENARVVRDRRGKVLYYEGIIQDITRRRGAETEAARLQQQLLQSQKTEAVGTLAGGIAHDFNNMLAAILGFTEMAVEDLPAASPVRANLQEALSAARRAKELVRQILAFSRQSQPERKPVEVGKIVHDALKLVRPALPTNVRLTEEIIAANDHAVADAVQLQQVLINLGTNAGYAMREQGGELRVTLENVVLIGPLPAGPYLKLCVRDNGRGIPPELLGRIFEPFFTTKPVGEGTGLGLAVVHGIVKSHGGEIEVVSAVGVGTTFTVYLPATSEASPPLIGELVSRRGNGERILVVDDEATLAQLLKQRLERLGYNARAMTNGGEAVAEFRARPDDFDLVITDYMMPDMTGLQFAAAIRGLRPAIPIVLCTGHAPSVARADADNANIQALLVKPVETGQLSEVLARLLAERAKGV